MKEDYQNILSRIKSDIERKSIDFIDGTTYIFDQSDPSNSGNRLVTGTIPDTKTSMVTQSIMKTLGEEGAYTSFVASSNIVTYFSFHNLYYGEHYKFEYDFNSALTPVYEYPYESLDTSYGTVVSNNSSGSFGEFETILGATGYTTSMSYNGDVAVMGDPVNNLRIFNNGVRAYGKLEIYRKLNNEWKKAKTIGGWDWTGHHRCLISGDGSTIVSNASHRRHPGYWSFYDEVCSFRIYRNISSQLINGEYSDTWQTYGTYTLQSNGKNSYPNCLDGPSAKFDNLDFGGDWPERWNWAHAIDYSGNTHFWGIRGERIILIRTYNSTNDTWDPDWIICDQLGGNESRNPFAESIAINKYGTFLASSTATYVEPNYGKTDTNMPYGRVQIFNKDSQGWHYHSLITMPDTSYYGFGEHMSFSDDGLVISISSYVNCKLAIFKYANDEWQLIGELSGLSSLDGRQYTIPPESYHAYGNESSYIYPFFVKSHDAFNSNSELINRMITVSGTLSHDGNKVLFGTSGHDISGSYVAAGCVRKFVYDRWNETWNQEGETMFGKSNYAAFGASLGASYDLKSLIIGAPHNYSNGVDWGTTVTTIKHTLFKESTIINDPDLSYTYIEFYEENQVLTQFSKEHSDESASYTDTFSLLIANGEISNNELLVTSTDTSNNYIEKTFITNTLFTNGHIEFELTPLNSTFTGDTDTISLATLTSDTDFSYNLTMTINNSGNNSYINDISNLTLSNGTTYNLLINYDVSSIKWYLNNNLNGTTNVSGISKYSKFYINNSQSNNSYITTYLIDNVSINGIYIPEVVSNDDLYIYLNMEQSSVTQTTRLTNLAYSNTNTDVPYFMMLIPGSSANNLTSAEYVFGGSSFLATTGSTPHYLNTDTINVVKFDSTNGYTYSIWVKYIVSSGGTVFTLGWNTNNYHLYNSNGVLYFYTQDTNSDILSGPIPTGEWNHFALTIDSDGKVFKLYINGKNVDTYTSLTTITPQGSYFMMGSQFGFPNMDGYLDEFRMFKRTLTDEEVKSLSFTFINI